MDEGKVRTPLRSPVWRSAATWRRTPGRYIVCVQSAYSWKEMGFGPAERTRGCIQVHRYVRERFLLAMAGNIRRATEWVTPIFFSWISTLDIL
jgi:hypothetical protein